MNNLLNHDEIVYSARNLLAYYGFEGYSNECESGENDFVPKKANMKGNSNNKGMLLFPNPALDEVQIIVQPEFVNGTISVTNIIGNIVLSLNSNSINTKIDIRKLQPGVYIIQIKSLNGAVAEKKLIVQ